MTSVRVGFFHDAPLTKSSEGSYYSSGFPYRLWATYLRAFDEVQVSTRLSKKKETSTKELSSGPKVSFKPIISNANRLGLGSFSYQTNADVRSAIASVDCVIARLPSVLGLIAYSAARRARKPVLIELVGCPLDAYRSHSNLGKMVAPIAYVLTRHAIRKAHFVSYVTRAFLQRRYPTDGESSACSDALLKTPDSQVLKTRLARIESSGRSPLILATIGAVDVRYKGQEYVLRAIARLVAREGRPIEYWIIGPGDSSRLRLMTSQLGIEPRIRFLGTQPHSRIMHLLEQVDIYVQPSFTEGLPRSVLEAFSVGCPVIASNVGGLPELLPQECMFNPGDVEAIANMVGDLDAAKLRDMAIQNLHVATEEYNPVALERRRIQFMRQYRTFVEAYSCEGGSLE